VDTLARQWHTTAAEQHTDEIADLRRRLAAVELRADRLEAAYRPALVKELLPILPENLENSAEGIADCLIDDIAAGTLYDELDINGHIESYLEGRTEYEADGFTPAELEPPF